MNDNTTINDRLLAFIAHKELSVYRFEKMIHKSKGFIDNCNIDASMAKDICRYVPELSYKWLAFGEGDMVNSNYVELTSVSSVKDRLIEFMKFSNIGMTAFEVKCGISIGLIAHIKNGISSQCLVRIALTYPELNIHWLLGLPNEEMLRRQKEDEEKIDLKNKIDMLIDILQTKK